MSSFRTIRIPRALIAGMIMAVASLASCSQPTRLTLDQALAAKQVSVVYSSRGTYGDVIVATITSNTDSALELSIERGMLLQNSTSGSESLVVNKYKGTLESESSTQYTEETVVSLGGRNASQIALLECYSINALADPTKPSDIFVASGKAAKGILDVLAAVADSDSIEAKQIAVWIITDNVTAADLDSVQFKYQPADLQAAQAILQRAGLKPADYKLFAS